MTNPLQAGVDHAELRRLAEAATPGPRFWARDRSNQPTNLMTSGTADYILSAQADVGDYGLSVDPWIDATDDDLAFIAAANPAVMLALLNEIDALRSAPVLPDRGWRPDREAVARILDPTSWKAKDGLDAVGVYSDYLSAGSLSKADLILALPDAPAEGGEA